MRNEVSSMDEEQEIEGEGSGQTAEEIPSAQAEDKAEEKVARKKRLSLSRNMMPVISGIMRRKPLFLSVAALVLISLGAWVLLTGTPRKGGGAEKPDLPSRKAAAEDGLRQEDISRFYIPLSKDSSNLALVVESSVVWDPISAVRFKKMEVSLRERLYDSLSRLFSKEDALRENIPAIEAEMNRILREALRTEALSVKVREVKVF